VRALPILVIGALAACGRGSIAAARGEEPGARVTVEGTVSVPSGVIDAGFAISDGRAGIYVAADSATRVSVGEGVRVRGVLADNHGLLSIRPDSIARIPGGTLPPPRDVHVAEVGEASEGGMVRIRGRAVAPVQNDLPYGYKLRVFDRSGMVQVFFPASVRGFGLERIRAGSAVAVSGFSAQYDTAYEVIPTAPADLFVSEVGILRRP
jgi:hypothetical protein